MIKMNYYLIKIKKSKKDHQQKLKSHFWKNIKAIKV